MKKTIVLGILCLLLFSACVPIPNGPNPIWETGYAIFQNNSAKEVFVQYYFEYRAVNYDKIIYNDNIENNIGTAVLAPGNYVREVFQFDNNEVLREPHIYFKKVVVIDAATHTLLKTIDNLEESMFDFSDRYERGEYLDHYDRYYTLTLF
jgi:hypothetical protein